MIVEVSPERAKELMEKVAVFFASRRLGAPALLFMESVRPLTFLGSQLMYMLAPFINVIFTGKEFEEFACVMSERENIVYLINRIDELDEEMNREIREQEKIKRAKFWKKIKRIFKKNRETEE